MFLYTDYKLSEKEMTKTIPPLFNLLTCILFTLLDLIGNKSTDSDNLASLLILKRMLKIFYYNSITFTLNFSNSFMEI